VIGHYDPVSAAGCGGGTEVAMRSTGNIDNVYALFRSPNQKILQLFKSNL
jgi:hypothetical protein